VTSVVKISPFDAAEYLGNQNAQAEYLAAAQETGDPEFIRDACELVTRAREMIRGQAKRPRQRPRGPR
jgi:DNA-binding phage protein